MSISFSMIKLNSFLFILILAGLTLLGFQCSNSNNSEKESVMTTDTLELKSIAKEKLGSKFAIKRNESKTFALVIEVNKGKIKSPVIPTLNYFIYDSINGEIIFEDKLTYASANWTNDSIITVSRPIGNIKKDTDSKTSSAVYHYNVKERKKSYK